MSKLLPFWIKVIRLTIPICIVGYIVFGTLIFVYISSNRKSDASNKLNLVLVDKKNQLNGILQNAKQDVYILANSIAKSSQNNSFDTLLLTSTLQKNTFYGDIFIHDGENQILIKLDGAVLSYTYTKQPIKSDIAKNEPSLSLAFSGVKKSSAKSIVATTSLQNNSNKLIGIDIPLQNIARAITAKSDSINSISTKIIIADEIQVSNSDRSIIVAHSQVEIDGAQLKIILEQDLSKSSLDTKNIGYRIILIGLTILIISLIAYVVLIKKATNPLDLLKSEIESAELNTTNPNKTYNGNDIVGWLNNTYNKLIMQIKHTTSQLDERDERLKHFYLATTDGIYIHHQGTPLIFNPALRNLTGYNEQELQKLRPNDFLIIDEEVLQAAQEQRFSLFEAELKTKQGEKLQVEVQMNEIVFRGQKAESLVIRDITHRKSIEQELQQERKRQVKSVIDGQEKERQRLSRELHDGLGQNLVAIKLKLESISAEQAGSLDGTLNQVKHMFSHTIDEIRRISNNLMPAALKEFSLAVVLRNLCTEIESNSGISIGLTIGVLPESLDQILKTYIYRIVQEALTNAVKHSGANKVLISIFSDFSNLHLQIEDNGVGFNTTKQSDSGNGLYNMKERTMLLGGKINIISSKGKGVKIVAEFPLNQTKSQHYV